MFSSSHTFAVTSGFFSYRYFESTKTLTCSFSTGAKMLQYHPSFLRALTQNPKAMFMLSLKHQSKISKNENYNTGLHWCSLESCAVGPSHEWIQRNLIERIPKTMCVTCCVTFQLGLFDRICTCTLTHLVSVILTGIWQRCKLCFRFCNGYTKQYNQNKVTNHSRINWKIVHFKFLKAYISRAKAFRTWEQIDVLISGGLALMIRRSITQWTSGVSL